MNEVKQEQFEPGTILEIQNPLDTGLMPRDKLEIYAYNKFEDTYQCIALGIYDWPDKESFSHHGKDQYQRGTPIPPLSVHDGRSFRHSAQGKIFFFPTNTLVEMVY